MTPEAIGDLRQAGASDDHAAILALVQTSFAYMEARIDPPSSMHRMTVTSVREHVLAEEVWIAEDSSGGVAACVFFTGTPDCLYLGKMAVRADCRGGGLARRMVAKAAERAHALGLPLLELETRIELTENHQAFARLGFVKTGEKAHAGYDRPTSITMQRPVSSA